MTPITEEYLISKGFVKVINSYVLKLDKIWKEEREIFASPHPKGWSCYYRVDGAYASKLKNYTEEVDVLIEVLK